MRDYKSYQFGLELKKRVSCKQEINKIADWAYSTYLKCNEKVDSELLQVMIGLSTMELGEEFEISYKTLDKIAENLIKGKNVDLNSKEYRENSN